VIKYDVEPSDVLLVSSGVYGDGIGEMAEMIGAQVKYVKFEWDESATDIARIRAAVEEFHPKLITVVHSETPCGTINPCDQIGAISKELGALLYVDFVSSGGGMKIDVDVREIQGFFSFLSSPHDF
jgi:aspartate aminotransferase-like enzyme